jgi:chloramphenicol 3-O phosphotransferase
VAQTAENGAAIVPVVTSFGEGAILTARRVAVVAYLTPDSAGTVVLLNGASCSGKTSIARALQEVTEEPWLHVGLDHFEAMQPRKEDKRVHCFYGQGITQPDLVPVLHQAVAAFSRMGAHVVNEHIFLERRWLADALERYRGLPVLFVGVLCPLDVLEQRERERHRGVQVGQSARQHAVLLPLHNAGLYDVAFDTTTTTPQGCAAEIRRRLSDGAFGRFSRITPQELP